jgi:hypothetical protein
MKEAIQLAYLDLELLAKKWKAASKVRQFHTLENQGLLQIQWTARREANEKRIR